MQVVFRPEALEELLEAQAWYEMQSVGLGFEFARAVDAAVEKMLRMPLAYPRIEADFRHVITRRFPYSIIYLALDQTILVISCFHHRRKPGTWAQNLNP